MSKHQLIIMSDGVPVPSELALTLKGFKAIWNQTNKEKAITEIGWIYWMYHLDSPFRQSYEEKERFKVVTEEVYGNKDKKIPAAVTNAATQYLEFYYKHNLSMKVVSAAESSIRELITYFDNVDMSKVNTKGDLVYNPKDVIANMRNISLAADALKVLHERAMKELESSSNKTRGGAVKTKYNT